MRFCPACVRSLITVILYFGVSFAESYHSVEAVDDPLLLPYRFSVNQILPGHDEKGNPLTEWWVPVDSFNNNQTGLYVIQNSWRESFTPIVFFGFLNDPLPVDQENINTAEIYSNQDADLNRDGVREVLITYTARDTAWLEVLTPTENQGTRLAPLMLATGIDRDGKGNWDGKAHIRAVTDLDGDGNDEILIACDAGYDLYPRKLSCIDWFRRRIAWEFPVAGLVSTVEVAELAAGEGLSIVVDVASKGNAAVAGDMDDVHSYVIVLDPSGILKWKAVTGGEFTDGLPTLIDVDGDGTLEVVTLVWHEVETGQTGISRTHSRLIVRDCDGVVRDSVDVDADGLVAQIYLCDINNDGHDDILVPLSTGELRVYDQRLKMLTSCRFYTSVTIFDCRDFLGRGDNQLLVRTADAKALLLDGDFEILAQYEGKFDLRHSHAYRESPEQKGFNLVLHLTEDQTNHVLSFARNPWWFVFKRNPALAFWIAFIPLSVVASVVAVYSLRIRAKNRQITRARDALDAALGELQAIQQKLVAAEKFKQARDIAGGFAHEIRNALFPARGALGKLLLSWGRSGTADDEGGRLLRLADGAVAHAVAITKSISQFTGLAGETAGGSVNLSRVIAEVLDVNRMMIEQRRIKVTAEGDDSAEVVGNPDQLQVVFNNLLLNSIDALTNVENPAIIMRWVITNEVVNLSFADNGCGIPQEQQDRIFDAFYSTKPDTGTGIGLSMTKRIIEMHGGTITVHSESGGGTAFVITLKRHDRLDGGAGT